MAGQQSSRPNSGTDPHDTSADAAFFQVGVGREGAGALDDTAVDGLPAPDASDADLAGTAAMQDTAAASDPPNQGASGGADPFAAFISDEAGDGELVLEEEANAGTRAELRLEAEVENQLSRSSSAPWQAPEYELTDEDLAFTDIDPEAGVQSIRRDFSVRAALASREGQFVVALLGTTVALGLGAYAAVDQQTTSIIIAGVVVPPAAIFGYIGWRRWIQNQMYSVRLLESLGEDTEELRAAAEERARRRLERRAAKAERALKSAPPRR